MATLQAERGKTLHLPPGVIPLLMMGPSQCSWKHFALGYLMACDANDARVGSYHTQDFVGVGAIANHGAHTDLSL